MCIFPVKMTWHCCCPSIMGLIRSLSSSSRIGTLCTFCSARGENRSYLKKSNKSKQFVLQTKDKFYFRVDSPLLFKKNITMLLRSPEAKKRKAPPNKAGDTNGPSAKKAKTTTESSSSEESSSEDEEAAKPTKAAPAGSFNNSKHIELMRLVEICH